MCLNNSSYGKYLGKHLGKHVNIMFDKMCCKYDDDNVWHNVFVYYDYHKCTESNRSQMFPKTNRIWNRKAQQVFKLFIGLSKKR